MLLSLYRGLTTVGGPLIEAFLHRRRRHGKEDAARLHERLGYPRRPRPDGPLVWLHAASVGESLSMLPVVEGILARGRPGATAPGPGPSTPSPGERPAQVPAHEVTSPVSVLVTTGTVTSAALMAERLPAGAFHQYIAVDRVAAVRRFLDHWRPGLVLWTESEFWPNTLLETRRRGIPVVLLNGRVSDRSFAGWQRWPGVISPILGGFDLCLGQTETDRDRLHHLGAGRVECLGNLKYAAPPLPADPGELACLGAAVAGRPVWLAASTHAGEEAIAAAVHRRLAERFPSLLTVIVPRHPPRGSAIADMLRALPVTVARRGAGEALTPATEVYLADTMGELGLFFRLAPVTFMGKSLVPLGGQNPLEAARLGGAVIFGPHMGNFADMAARLRAAGAAREVADATGLAEVVGSLLADPAARTAMATAGQTFAAAEAGVLDRVLTALDPFLDRMGLGAK